MKSYDYDAIVVDGEVYCVDCRPKSVRLDDPAVQPIFADSEWDSYPVCCECGTEHDYVTLLSDCPCNYCNNDTCSGCEHGMDIEHPNGNEFDVDSDPIVS